MPEINENLGPKYIPIFTCEISADKYTIHFFYKVACPSAGDVGGYLEDIWRTFGGRLEDLKRNPAGNLEGVKRRLEGNNLAFKNLIYCLISLC